jgi:hypothetical protein
MSPKTITIRLKGGLGNQLFQYAAAKNIAVNNGLELLVDVHSGFVDDVYKRSFALSVFNIKAQIVECKKMNQTIVHKLIKFWKFKSEHRSFITFGNNVIEKTYNFSDEIEKYVVSKSIILEGYFQSEKYFKNIRNIILEEFKFTVPPDTHNLKILEEISLRASVSIHVRKYDNSKTIDSSAINGICSLDYYQKAIMFMQEKLQNPCFYLFSDDMEWVKENLKISGGQVVYMDFNGTDNDREDFRLMSACKHNIVANSSFSWWAAWLNSNPYKIVIAPNKWLSTTRYDYKDVVPDNWIKF